MQFTASNRFVATFYSSLARLTISKQNCVVVVLWLARLIFSFFPFAVMRKPALDAAPEAEASHHENETEDPVRNDTSPRHGDGIPIHHIEEEVQSVNADEYSAAIAGDIGAETATHGVDKDEIHLHDPSVDVTPPTCSIPASAAAAASSVSSVAPSAAALHLDQREERVKKSVAYRHTDFYRLLVDNVGKEYERRVCHYCNAVFSFKGGTTSAALRHLKTAHPERILYAGVAGSHQIQQQIQQQYGDATDLTGDPHAGAHQGAVEGEENAGDQGQQLHHGSGYDDTNGQYTEAPAVHENGELGDGDDTMKGDSGTFGASPLVGPKQGRSSRGRYATKRKRDAENGKSGGDAKKTWTPPPLTASQLAITHFLQQHKEMLSLASRLRFVKHLTHNPSEAEMYNVLDDATRMEYIKEFTDDVTTI